MVVCVIKPVLEASLIVLCVVTNNTTRSLLFLHSCKWGKHLHYILVICARPEAFLLAVDLAQSSNDFGYLHFLIDNVLGNVRSLSHSFMIAEDNNASVPPSASLSTELDFEAVDRIYTGIQHLKSDETEKKLSCALETSARNLATQSKQFTSENQLVPICILLQCPLFMEPSMHDALVHMMRAVLLLSPSLKVCLKNLWVGVPRELFQGIISVFQQFITVKLYSLGFIDENIAYATRLLGILNDINEMKRQRRRQDFVEYSEFYNDAVNNIVDLRQDYMRWLRTRRAHRTYVVFC